MKTDDKIFSPLLPVKRIMIILLICLPGLAACDGVRKKPACIVDIDRTITDARYMRRTLHRIALPAARDALRRIEERGTRIIYLSKRMEWKLPKTVKWLEANEFPAGEMIIHKKDPEEDGVEFKLREIRKIQESYRILYGFGNLNDEEIYQRAGIRPICRDPWRNEDWEKVIDNLDRLREDEWE